MVAGSSGPVDPLRKPAGEGAAGCSLHNQALHSTGETRAFFIKNDVLSSSSPNVQMERDLLLQIFLPTQALKEKVEAERGGLTY